MFLDEADVDVRGGDGGDGAVAFRREKYVAFGGPAGGDGGDGGSVYLVADERLVTLADVAARACFAAENGRPGRGKAMHGKKGRDLEVPVPPGTVVRDEDGELLGELTGPGQRLLVARGGRGGRGNKAFASATDRTPRHAEKGEPGQHRRLRLELKLVADVGFVGLPNAGKSTLLAALSNAHPRVADYPFTTLSPVLGIAGRNAWQRMVLADLPGLIEGAHAGKGLGDRFLRHIERTRIVLHLVDVSLDDPVKAYRTIRGELSAYSASLAGKTELVALTKCDKVSSRKAKAEAGRLGRVAGASVVRISALSGEGLRKLLDILWRTLRPDGK